MNHNTKPDSLIDDPLIGSVRASDESFNHLEAILGSINDGVIVADLRGNINSMNPAALAIHGFKNMDEARAHLATYADTFEIFDTDSQPLPIHRWPMSRALAGEQFSGMEIRIQRKDTGRVWYGSYSGTPVWDRKGDVILAVLTLREITGQKLAEEAVRKAYDELEDRVRERTAALSEANAKLHAEISEREQVEKALRQREAELNEAQRVAGVGSWTWIPATDTSTWSLETYHICGFDPVLPLPKRAERWEIFCPKSLARLEEAIANTIQTGAAYELDVELVRPDGIRKWVRACGAGERDATGKVVKLHGTALDITARKRVEEELRRAHDELEIRVAGRTAELFESHTKLAAILESITDGFLTIDRDWRYTRVNPAALKFLRMQPEELVGRIIWDVFPALDSTRFGAVLRRSMDENVPTQVEEFYPEPLNCWYECRSYPSPGGLTLFFTDVTERKHTEEALFKAHEQLEKRVEERTVQLTKTNAKLEEEIAGRRRLEEEILQIAEREQRRLGQDLHDDLGQQLTGIGMLSKILAADLRDLSHPKADDATELADMLKHAIGATRRLAKGFYPIELERGGLVMALTDLAQRVQLVSQVHCEVRHDTRFRFNEAHSIHLYRIVQEALTNAVKHGNPRNIVIECTARKDLPVLAVHDDGAGFKKPKRNQAGMGLHLFQYRARLIGAKLTVKKGKAGGCEVECCLAL